jgi:hypothetical protein
MGNPEGPRTTITVTVIPASGKIWDKSYGSARGEEVWTIAPANGRGYILGGTRFIIKTDEDGNVIWQNPLPTSTLIVYSILPQLKTHLGKIPHMWIRILHTFTL